jgi:hypothetical protein
MPPIQPAVSSTKARTASSSTLKHGDELGRVGGGEAQILAADFEQAAQRAQPRQRHGGAAAGGDDGGQRVAAGGQNARDQGVDLGIEQLRVVDHQHRAIRAVGREGGDQLLIRRSDTGRGQAGAPDGFAQCSVELGARAAAGAQGEPEHRAAGVR